MYEAFFDEMQKLAEEEKKSPAKDILKIIGKSALGVGAGTATGLLLGHGADLLFSKATGRKIPKSVLTKIAPVVGGLGGLAYSIHKAKEQEAMRRAFQDSADSRIG